MRIINFRKHEKPILVGFKKHWEELATFDIEFPCSGATLTWCGWTIRKVGALPVFLQAPLIYKASMRKIQPCIKIDKIPTKMFLKLLRNQIKTRFGFEVPEPMPQAKERKQVFREKKKEFKSENRTLS